MRVSPGNARPGLSVSFNFATRLWCPHGTRHLLNLTFHFLICRGLTSSFLSGLILTLLVSIDCVVRPGGGILGLFGGDVPLGPWNPQPIPELQFS